MRKIIGEHLQEFIDNHPNFPLWVSIIALICSIAMPILRKFLA